MYRDDVEALRARHAALEAEVADRARARDEVAQLLLEARAREDAERRLADIAAGGPARRHRRRLLIAAATVLALVATIVAYRTTRPRHDFTAEAMERFSFYADQTCNCPDAACAKQIQDEMMRWVQSLPPEVRTAPPRLTQSQQKRLTDLVGKMSSCTAKLNNVPD